MTNRRIREFLSVVTDIEKCGSVYFWNPETQGPCCPLAHATVARGGFNVIITSAEFGVAHEARMMYMTVWDNAGRKGMDKKKAHELALMAAEILEEYEPICLT